jgi:hypothetical protein
MIKGGIGGAKTKTGLVFESRTDLRTAFIKFKDYTANDGKLFFKSKLVAELYKKHDFYNKFLNKHKIDFNKLISKKLLPDEAIFVIKNKTLFIIEMKFQEVAGSVDEKLQTCDFKKKQYQKLLKKTKLKIEYVYILSDWFKHEIYKDVLQYIKNVKCHYFFETLPFEFLGLPISK